MNIQFIPITHQFFKQVQQKHGLIKVVQFGSKNPHTDKIMYEIREEKPGAWTFWQQLDSRRSFLNSTSHFSFQRGKRK